MLKSRVIPFLLLSNGGLVKTVQFGERRYVGDPVNAIRIFNEKEADELCLLDIDASVHNREPDYDLIRAVADQCRMSLAYGGGIRTCDQAAKILRLGVEKVCVSSAALEQPGLVTNLSREVGTQSVAVVLDVKHTALGRTGYEVVKHNGTRRTGLDPVSFAAQVADKGAGEIVINSVDLDGTMRGYDLDLARQIRDACNTPLTIVGGASSSSDIAGLIAAVGPVGAGVGSLFVFKGRHKAVLINYSRPSV